MKISPILAAMLCALPLAACNNTPSDKLADRVENAADARANALENQAEVLEERADDIRETGEQRAAAIDAADRNVKDMTQAQRDAIVANDAAAVR